MTIYCVMIEAVPNLNNPERSELGGAYINCWVKASTQVDAHARAKEYIKEQNWAFIKTEDIWEVQRQDYMDQPEFLECYDEACERGFSACFYTWPIDADDAD